jgi:Fe-S cluster biogenesis protein NfuA
MEKGRWCHCERLKIKNKNARICILMGGKMRERIEKVLEEEVRPVFAMHGGSVELIDVTCDNVVKVKLTGACCGCPMAQATLPGVVEEAIKSHIPEVKKVEV